MAYTQHILPIIPATTGNHYFYVLYKDGVVVKKDYVFVVKEDVAGMDTDTKEAHIKSTVLSACQADMVGG